MQPKVLNNKGPLRTVKCTGISFCLAPWFWSCLYCDDFKLN